MAGVSSLGVGSGLDLESLLTKLSDAEKVRLSPLVSQKKQIDAKISAFGKLNSALSAFNKATKKLTDEKIFTDAKITISNEKYFSAKSTGGAINGNYTVDISQLATAHSLTSGSVSGKTTELLGNGNASRTLTITQADGEEMEIILSQDETSLEGIAKAINKADGDVSASIVKTSDNTSQIILTSKKTGEANAISSVSSSDSALNDIIGFDANDLTGSALKETIEAQDAKFQLNGIDIVSATNVIEDAITGVTLTLKAVTPENSGENFIVEPSSDAYIAAIKEWVTAYNSLQDSIKGMTNAPDTSKGSSDDEPVGALLGDATLRNIQQRIGSIFSHGENGDLATLDQLGITKDEKGQLVVDDDKLGKVLKEKRGAAIDFFVGDGEFTGLATKLQSYMGDILADDGLLKTETQGLNKSLDVLSKRYDEIDASIEANIERYRKQFVQLDMLVSKMNSTSNYLSQQFAAMNSTN